jgi:iron complex transport system substrate-binding protein
MTGAITPVVERSVGAGPTIVDDATRRQFLAVLAGSGLLTGCGNDPRPSGSGAQEGYPRTVRHLGGETTFESRPTRVISEGNFSEFDNLLALGIPVLARGSGKYEISDPREDLTPWQVAAGGADVPLNQGVYGVEPNLEEIIRLGGEILFVTQANFAGVDAAYRRRDEVIPTVVVPDGLEGIRTVADVFDVSDTDVERLLDEAQQAFDSFSPDRIPTSITAFYFFDDGNFNLASAQAPVNEHLLDPLGLPRLTPTGDTAFPPNKTISTELTPELEADLVIALYDGNFVGALDKLEQDPLFRALPAVREGRYRRASPEFTAAFNRTTVLSVDTAVEGFTDLLAET